MSLAGLGDKVSLLPSVVRAAQRLAAEIYGVDGSAVEIQEAAFHMDESIAHYAMIFRERLRDAEAVTELELNAVAQLLGAHMLRRYSNLARRPLSYVDRKLSHDELHSVTDYMSAHIDSALRLPQLAAVIGMNQYGFARAFHAATGDSPHKYLMRLRIARAQELLTASSLPLSTIAATVGFASQSHMTLAFQRRLSITPGRYRSETGNVARHASPALRSVAGCS